MKIYFLHSAFLSYIPSMLWKSHIIPFESVVNGELCSLQFTWKLWASIAHYWRRKSKNKSTALLSVGRHNTVSYPTRVRTAISIWSEDFRISSSLEWKALIFNSSHDDTTKRFRRIWFTLCRKLEASVPLSFVNLKKRKLAWWLKGGEIEKKAHSKVSQTRFGYTLD